MTREIAILRATIKEKNSKRNLSSRKTFKRPCTAQKKDLYFQETKKEREKTKNPKTKKKIFENIVSLYIYSFSLYSQLFVYFGNLKNTIFEKVKLHKSLNPLNQTF